MTRPLLRSVLLLTGMLLQARSLPAADPSTQPTTNPQIAALSDGQAVQLKTNQPTPIGRGYCARMPYDPANKVGIVYGACHNPGRIAQNDVWTFDAATSTWTELLKTDPSGVPMRHSETGVLVPKDGPPRLAGVGHTYNVICFDEGLGKMVSLRGGTPPWLAGWPKPDEVERMKAAAAAGGVDLAKARRSLPWLFDVKTASWSLAATSSPDTPSHTRAEACCYDPKHKRVLYWSTDGDVANKKGGVYAYDGAANTWTFSATKGGPAPGIEQLACWDSVNQRVLYFSGGYTAKVREAKAFNYETLTWTSLGAKDWPKRAMPHPRDGDLEMFCSGGSTLSFDSLNGVALVFSPRGGRVVVHPYDVRTNTFGPTADLFAHGGGGQLISYYDPDQNAVIVLAGNDLQHTQTWAYRYKRAPASR